MKPTADGTIPYAITSIKKITLNPDEYEPMSDGEPACRYRITMEPVNGVPQTPGFLRAVERKELPVPPVENLWGEKWKAGQLCIISGDTGAGKSKLVQDIAKGVSSALGFKTLYVDFNFSSTIPEENELLVTAVCANDYKLSDKSGRRVEDLFAELKAKVKQCGAKALLLDSPDRLWLTATQWALFLQLLYEWKEAEGISVLITVNNRARHTNRPLRLSAIYKADVSLHYADNIIGLARHLRNEKLRYVSEPTLANSRVEVIDENFNCIKKAGYAEVLPITKADKKTILVLKAEQYFFEGYTPGYIAALMDLPVSTVKGWLKNVDADDFIPGETIKIIKDGKGLEEITPIPYYDFSKKPEVVFIGEVNTPTPTLPLEGEDFNAGEAWEEIPLPLITPP